MSEKDFRVPPAGPIPLPTPEHQRRITRNKWFEVIMVVLMIVVGFGYLGVRNYLANNRVDPARTLGESARTLEHEGAAATGTANLYGRQVLSFQKKEGIFDCHIDLLGKSSDSPLETAIIWLTPGQGEWEPKDNSLQDAVNNVGKLGQKLVKSSADALDKAVNTMELITDTDRPHDKGVAATSDGWKLTYITYRSFDETGSPQAVLYLIVQRMSAGEDPSLAVFNRVLFDAIHRGVDAKQAIEAAATTGETK